MSAAGKLICLFCGGRLTKETSANRLSCPACRAVFLVRRNKRTCVTQVSVTDCGAGPACCQRKRRPSS